MVRLPGRGGVEEMAVAAGSPGRVPMGPSQCNPQAPPSSARSDCPSPIRHREQSSPMKNRMLEIGASGSVRGEDGNILTYSAIDLAQRRHVRLEGSDVIEAGVD